MPRKLALFLIGVALVIACVCSGQGSPNDSSPCVTTAEAQGIDSAVLSRGLRQLSSETKHLHSLLIARNSCVVIEAYWPPYNRETKHYLNSATKAVLSALVGIAVHEKSLRESAPVLSYLPAYARGDDDPRRREITVRDLLTMSSGISWRQSPPDNTSDDMGHSPDWVRFILQRPMAADPGKLTNYSNGDSHLLSAALQNAVGETVLRFAQKKLFAPLGIQDVAWDHDPQGRNIGSAALQMRPIDMAKIGFLYLRGGRFKGRRILVHAWVDRSLSAHTSMPARGARSHTAITGGCTRNAMSVTPGEEPVSELP